MVAPANPTFEDQRAGADSGSTHSQQNHVVASLTNHEMDFTSVEAVARWPVSLSYSAERSAWRGVEPFKSGSAGLKRLSGLRGQLIPTSQPEKQNLIGVVSKRAAKDFQEATQTTSKTQGIKVLWDVSGAS